MTQKIIHASCWTLFVCAYVSNKIDKKILVFNLDLDLNWNLENGRKQGNIYHKINTINK
jgi:hypothetical protein